MMTTLQNKKDQELNTDLWVWIGRLALGMIIWTLLPLLLPNLFTGALWDSEQLAWYLVRASGTVAYMTMTASMLWGLLLSSKMIKEIIPAPLSLAMHNTLSWISLCLTIFHAVMLLFDSYYTYTISDLLVPFTGPYSPLWVGIGIIGFYIMLITTLSFYARKQIGQKNWRRLHYLAFGAYLMVTVHGLMAGTDTGLLGSMFGASAVSVIFLTLYRIMAVSSDSKAKRLRQQAQVRR